MVAGLLFSGCWVVSQSMVAGMLRQWLLGCYHQSVAGLLVNGCWVVSQWLLGC